VKAQVSDPGLRRCQGGVTGVRDVVVEQAPFYGEVERSRYPRMQRL